MRVIWYSTLLILITLISTSNSFAQSPEYKWGLSLGGGVVSYREAPNSPELSYRLFDPVLNISASKYLAGAFDFRTSFTYAPAVRFPISTSENRESQLLDLNYNLIFKVNNGVFLKHSSFIGPYLLVGVGGSYVENNPDVYLPFGGGVKFRINHRWSLGLEAMQKTSFNKDFQNTSYLFSAIYSIGRQEIKKPPVEKEAELPPLIVEDEQENDSVMIAMEEEQNVDTLDENTVDNEILAINDERLADSIPDPVEPANAERIIPTEEESTNEEIASTPNFPAIEVEPEEIIPVEEIISESEPVEEPPIESPAEIVVIEEESQSEIAAIESESKSHEEQPPQFPADNPCQTLALEMDDLANVYFEVGSNILRDEARQNLNELAALMKSCSHSKLILRGHADAVGQSQKNLILSIERAHQVKYYLVAHHGISQTRIDSRGFGEEIPFANNDSESGRGLNRRVEVQLRLN